MERIIMHIDVNNAFLSWTAIDLLRHGEKVDIRKTYAVIGNEKEKRHGIVLAKSTPIKKLGVKTAEPIFMARKKCPSLKVYPPHFKWYKYMSHKMFSLIESYVPTTEKFSIDECFLDYTAYQNIYGVPLKFAYKLKNEIERKLGFTVNIGVANSKLCAKMASDFEKPNRVHTLFNYEIDRKMKPLPIEDLFFIGKKTAAKLRSLNINTIYDLSITDPDTLYPDFKNSAYKMVEYANGIDNSKVEERGPRKGFSNSVTTTKNLIHVEEVYEILKSISENLSASLKKEKRYARVVRVSLKNSTFKTYSHQMKLDNPTSSANKIYESARKLAKELWRDEKIRLVSLALDSLTDEVYFQTSIFDDNNNFLEEKKLDDTLREIKNKFGTNVIVKASSKSKKH